MVLFVLSAQPHLPLPEEIPESDKLAHVLAYGVLGWLWTRAVSINWPTWAALSVFLSTIAFTGAYGLSDEWHQMYVRGRSVSLLDALADVCGGALGGASFQLWLRYWDNRGNRVTRELEEELRDPYDPAA
jgi:VanZ family protein